MAKKKEREELGDAAPPKEMPKTLDSMRTPDETMVEENDEEILLDEEEDEWSQFFKEDVEPKLLITTQQGRTSQRTKEFVEELQELFPHAEYVKRKNFEMKLVTKYAIKRGFTDLIVITEQVKQPYIVIMSHLPQGPTATFRMTSLKLHKEIENAAPRTKHAPELNMKGFGTRVGRRVGRMLRALFKLSPNLKGRAIATFHNQRDFIFFRRHRYIFDSMARVRIQELGPRFTLRLKALQAGLWDRQFGEYEWAYHKKEMGGKDRKMFNL
uniref:Brix domain-containing protein n=1 Tax=Eutreptiella gymnastica TaxID=73025 RepID=A0A7S4GLG9_9EUGL